jgi:hypothetical protein
MTRNPTLPEVINDAVDGALAGLYMHLPARVVRYDAATQLCDAQPINKVRYQDEDGNAVIEALPVITSVPVIFPGGGDMTITFPVEVGDTVMLEFSGVSLDKWLQTATSGTLDPGNHGRHSIADAIATPGLRNARKTRKNMPTDHVLIGEDGGTAHGAALGDSLKTYVLGVTGAGTDPTCLQGFLTLVATALSLTPPNSPAALESATVKVTE